MSYFSYAHKQIPSIVVSVGATISQSLEDKNALHKKKLFVFEKKNK